VTHPESSHPRTYGAPGGILLRDTINELLPVTHPESSHPHTCGAPGEILLRDTINELLPSSLRPLWPSGKVSAPRP
ncbi:hypothetical protein AVEN_30947-1, partial [Araneus ventricosus]